MGRQFLEAPSIQAKTPLRQRSGPSLVILVLAVLCLVVVSSPAFANGDGPPRHAAAVTEPYWEQDVGGLIREITTGDLDGDGQREILVGTDTGELRVLNADGRTLWQYSLEVERPVMPILVTDLVGDDRAQVLISDGISRTLVLRSETVMEENQDRVLRRFDRAGRAVVTADLTGDDSPEILIGSDDSNLYALDRSGDLRWHFPTGGSVGQVAAADLDGDGSPDILIGSDDSGVYALDHSGALQWEFPTEGSINSLSPADVNGDGLPGVLVGSSDGNVYALDGTGKELWRYSAIGAVTSVAAADLNDDGRAEVVVGSPKTVSVLDAAGQVLWEHPAQGDRVQASVVGVEGVETGSPAILVQDNLGAFILRQRDGVIEQVRFFGGGTQAPAAFSDLNGDGIGELVVAANSKLRLFGYSIGEELTGGLRQTFSTGGPVSTADFGHVDGDGRFDIVAGSFDRKVYLLQEGTPAIPVQTTNGTVNVVRLADLDGDGVDEILAGSTDGRVYAHHQDLLWRRPTQGEVKSLAAADLDGDGKPEVLAGSGDFSLYALRAEDGQVMWQFPTEGPVASLATGDLNGDGRPEVVAGSFDNHVYALAGMGDTYEERWRTDDLGDGVVSVFVADLDPDHSPQVVAGTLDGQVYAFRGEDGWLLWQHQVGPLNSMATADLDGDGQLEVVIGSSDENVYVLSSQPDRPDWVMWRIDAGDVINSVAAADVDGDGLPEVLAGTRDGSVYVLRGTRELIARYPVGGGVLHLAGVDIDGDGLAEIVATSNDGNAYLIGLILNQAALLVNDDCARVEDGWNCSVDVVDPDSPKVDVPLQVFDPASLPWDQARHSPWIPLELRAYDGQGEWRTLVWSVKQSDWFDWWDRGRKSRFRIGMLQPTLEFTVPGLPWWVLITLPFLLGLLLASVGANAVRRRRRSWAESPPGQARQLFDRIARNPRGLLIEIKDVIVERGDAARILSELHLLYQRQEGQSAQADVAQGYALILGRPDVWEAGLRSLVSGLAELDEVAGQAEALAVYRLLLDGLGANSVPRIAALRSQIEAAQPLVSASVLGLSGLVTVLKAWLQIIFDLQSYQKVAPVEDKRQYLGLAVEHLGSQAKDVRLNLVEPERSLLEESTSRWLAVVNNALSELRGRAELKVVLKRRRVLAVGDVSLVLRLRNEGNAAAENITVSLLPSQQYEILKGARSIHSLSPDESDSVEVRLRPRVEGDFRARFQISYDDEQRQGRVLTFADRVSLVKAEGRFQPIINPYHVGRPLEAGSPLFYGREKDFEFIKKNISGRYQENVLVLIGQRRTGKTSLLKQLPLELDKQRYVPVYIDLQGLVDPGMASFFHGLSHLIASDLRAQGIQVTPPSREHFKPAPSATFENQFLAESQEALGDRRLVLAFDEFEELEMRVRDGKLDRDIFPFLRHLMQHSEKLACIFAGTHRLQQLTSDYWSIFFNIALHRDIRFLDEAPARRLVTEPVKDDNVIYDELAVDEILDVTACHPYFLQLMCFELVNLLNNRRRNYVTVDDVRESVDGILDRGEAQFHFVWANASARERLALAALTRLLARERMVASSDIANLLAEHGRKMDPKDVSVTLNGLVNQDIVKDIGDRVSLRYIFKLDLMRRWIERFKPLSAVVEEVT